jgi:hypothetical protein
VPIALNHLRRHGAGASPAAADRASIDGSRCANMPTAPESLPTESPRARGARARSRCDLRVPERELHAERHRLGVHAVRAADHRRRRCSSARRDGVAPARRRPRIRSQRSASAAPAPCRARPTR